MNFLSSIVTRSKSRQLVNTNNSNSFETSFFNNTHNTSTSTQIPQVEMTSDNMKLPKFWASCPEAWFTQVEGLFLLKGVHDDNIKYLHVITSLSEDVVTKITDVFQSLPNRGKYEFIKTNLLKRYSLSEDNRLEKVLDESELGDRKPSELFRDMSTVAYPILNKEVIFKLWSRKLPRNIQTHIASSNISNIDEKLQLADKIYDISKNYKSDISEIQNEK